MKISQKLMGVVAMNVVGIIALMASSSFAGANPQQNLSVNEQDFLTIASVKVTAVPNTIPVVSPSCASCNSTRKHWHDRNDR